MRLDQEGLLMFLKEQLPKDFGYDEDEVVDQLKSCIEDLRQARLQPAKPSPAAERAHTAPGQLVAASLARRSAAPVSNNISGRQATSVVVEQRQPGAVAPDSRRSQASQRARSTSPISPVNAADGKAGFAIVTTCHRPGSPVSGLLFSPFYRHCSANCVSL